MFSLVRNIGSSVGISVVVSALSHNIRANHAALAEHIDDSSLPLRLAIESGERLLAIDEARALHMGRPVEREAADAQGGGAVGTGRAPHDRADDVVEDADFHDIITSYRCGMGRRAGRCDCKGWRLLDWWSRRSARRPASRHPDATRAP